VVGVGVGIGVDQRFLPSSPIDCSAGHRLMGCGQGFDSDPDTDTDPDGIPFYRGALPPCEVNGFFTG